MSKRLLAAQPYTPVDGVNFDSNALTIGEKECHDILNLRTLPHQVQLRGGSRQVASVAPSGDPVIHTHTFKAPNGEERVFGFTKRSAYRLNFSSTSGTWDSAYGYVGIDVTDSATNWGVGSGFFLTGSTIYPPIPPVLAGNTQRLWLSSGLTATKNAGDLLIQRANLSALDLTGTNNISFYSGIEGTGVGWALTLKTYSGTNFTGLLETINFSLPSVVGTTKVSIPLSNPALYGTFRSFEILFNQTVEFVSSTDVALGFNHFYAEKSFSADITFWSSADFVDTNLGSTIVAAGSIPPQPTDAESDGGQRVLLYYDQATSTFKTLTQRTTVRTTGVATGADGGGANRGPFSFTLANAPLVPFSINLTSSGLRAYDTGAGTFGGDATGTVNYTTGAVVITFTSGVGGIAADYMYYATVTKMPRFVSTHATRLIMGSTYESSTYLPWRVAWSDVADITVVRDDSYKDTVEDDISAIQAFSFSGEYMVIYKQSTVLKMRYVGGDSTFGFYTVWRYGLLAMRSVIEYNNINFLLSHDDVYIFDGNQFRAIATNRIRNHLFSHMNRARLQYFFGSFDEKYKEYWLWTVVVGQSYPTCVYVYSLQRNSWSYFEFEPTTCVGKYYSLSGLTYDELIGTYNQQNWTFNSGTLAGTLRTPIMCLAAGDVYTYDDRLAEDYIINNAGTAIAYRLITRDVIYADLGRKDRTQRVHFEAAGESTTVGHSTNYSQDVNEFVNKVTIALDGENREKHYWPDTVFEKIRLSFEGSGQFILRWIQAFSITEGLD